MEGMKKFALLREPEREDGQEREIVIVEMGGNKLAQVRATQLINEGYENVGTIESELKKSALRMGISAIWYNRYRKLTGVLEEVSETVSNALNEW